MNNPFTKILNPAVLSVGALCSVMSCVNEDYDLSKGLDMDMQLLQNTTVPIGNISTVTLETLLKVSDNEMIKTDEDGNLSLSFFQDSRSETFILPDITLDGEGGLKPANADVSFKIPAGYTEVTGNILAENLNKIYGSDNIYYTDEGITHNLNESLAHAKMYVSMDKELPKQIISIRKIDMKALLEFVFSTSKDAIIHLNQGVVIDFPHYMILVPTSRDRRYSVEEGHKVIINEPVKIGPDSPFLLSFYLTTVCGCEELVKERTDAEGNDRKYLVSNETIDVYGIIHLKASDYGDDPLPARPELNMSTRLANMSMISAEAIVDMDKNFEDTVLEISEIPEIFMSNANFLDLYDPTLRVTIDNDSPLELNFNTELTATSGSHSTDIHIGDNCIHGNHETDPVTVFPKSKVDYYFSRHGKHGDSSGKDIEISEISEIISKIPDEIIVHDTYIESERKYINFKAKQEYKVFIDTEFFSPLSFGKDLNIWFNYDIPLGLEGAVGVENLILTMDMVNSIPLDFELEGMVLDSKGNEVKGAKVDMDCKLLAGTLEDPVSSPVQIGVTTDNYITDFATLRLRFNATSRDEIQGEVLNMNQGLTINNIHVSLPQGIKLDLTDKTE